jgi:S1-C subfamily serine protease
VETTDLYPQLAEELDLDADSGALVSEVVPGGPADEAGLQGGTGDPIRFQAQEIDAGGDLILAVDGEEIESNFDLPRIISLLEPGDEVTLEIIRDGEEQELDLTLGERPDTIRP